MQSIINRKIEKSYIQFLNAQMLHIQNKMLRDSFDVADEKHRLERYLSVRGVAYFDDAKSQNVNSLWYSLERIVTEMTLIIHNSENIEKLASLQSLLQLKVRNVIVLGDDTINTELLHQWIRNVYYVSTIEEAVLLSSRISEPSESVLYSPVVEVNMEHMSGRFKEAIRSL